MATHASILAWRIPWTEEPGGLQSMGSQRVGHGWSDLACTYHACMERRELFSHRPQSRARRAASPFWEAGFGRRPFPCCKLHSLFLPPWTWPSLSSPPGKPGDGSPGELWSGREWGGPLLGGGAGYPFQTELHQDVKMEVRGTVMGQGTVRRARVDRGRARSAFGQWWRQQAQCFWAPALSRDCSKPEDTAAKKLKSPSWRFRINE